MLIHFSQNYFKQVLGIVAYNYKSILLFIALAVAAFITKHVLMIEEAALPIVPVTILGGGLAIFLAFKNNAAYDRWWEARKVWGALVNDSRSFGMEVMSLITLRDAHGQTDQSRLSEIQDRIIKRHIAYINALRLSLRDDSDWEQVKPYLSTNEYEEMLGMENKPTFINHMQGQDLNRCRDLNLIDDFRHMEMVQLLKAFYDHQGKSERIKKTVFPYYYTYFTGMFLWLFIILLPFALVGPMMRSAIPLSIAISFSFYILDKSGNVTEDPFENRASDTPLTAICRTIEIDMLRQLGEKEVPEPVSTELTTHGVKFLR